MGSLICFLVYYILSLHVGDGMDTDPDVSDGAMTDNTSLTHHLIHGGISISNNIQHHRVLTL